MATHVDDSAETVLPIYVEAFDRIGFERARPQGVAPASEQWVRCLL